MDIDSLTLGEAEQLAKLFCGGASLPLQTHPYVGKYVVVRTYSAGVHFGTLQSASGTDVVLANARRLYSWSGAFTLSAVSQEGITGGQVSMPVPTIALTQAIEIIPTSAEAEKCLTTFKTHKP